MGWFGPGAGQRSIARIFVGAVALLSSYATHAAPDSLGNARVLYFEPFTTTIDPRPALTQKTSRSRQMKFDAYGRSFELSLEPQVELSKPMGCAR